MNSYYENQLKVAAYGMIIAARYASYSEKEGKNKRIQSRIIRLLHKIELTKTKDKRKVLSQIYRITRKITSNEKLLSVYDIEKNIKEQYGRSLDSKDIHNIARTVADDALTAVTRYASEYIGTIELMESENKRQEENKKQEERQTEYSDSTYNYSSSRTYSSERKFSSTEPKRTAPSTTKETQPDYSKIKVEELLDSRKEYSYSDKEVLEALLRGCAKNDKKEESAYVYNDFYGKDQIEELYKFFKLTDKKRRKHDIESEYQKIVEMGMLAPTIIFNNIMGYGALKGDTLRSFINSFKPYNALMRYEGARVRWLKKYKHLNNKNKQIVNSAAESQEEYRKMFNIFGKTGANIATAEDIKRVVNSRVREHLRENSPFNHIDRGLGNSFDLEYRARFRIMVQYMSIEEIASLYHSIVNDYSSSYYRFSRNYSEEQKTTATANFEQQIANFQELCASVISSKLTSGIKNTNNKKEEEQSEKDFISICREILGEEPKLDIYRAKAKFVSQEYSKKRIASTRAVTEAKRRYYGMNKFNRTVAILSKRKLERLNKKELLSKSQIEQVDNMFRR